MINIALNAFRHILLRNLSGDRSGRWVFAVDVTRGVLSLQRGRIACIPKGKGVSPNKSIGLVVYRLDYLGESGEKEECFPSDRDTQ